MPNNTMNEIGALWLQTSKKGTKFMKGKIEGVEVVVFKNTFKEADNQPDYRVYRSEPKPLP